MSYCCYQCTSYFPWVRECRKSVLCVMCQRTTCSLCLYKYTDFCHDCSVETSLTPASNSEDLDQLLEATTSEDDTLVTCLPSLSSSGNYSELDFSSSQNASDSDL